MPHHDTIESDEILRRYSTGVRDFRGLEIEDPPGATPLAGATLDDVDFTGAYILVDFHNATLRRARFVQANVKTCCFDRADLTDANFSEAALCSATFSGACLEGAVFERATVHSYIFGPGELPD